MADLHLCPKVKITVDLCNFITGQQHHLFINGSYLIIVEASQALHDQVSRESAFYFTLAENPQKWATKFVYHTSNGGPLDSIRQYLTSSKGQQLFLDKIDFYQKRYGSDTLFFGWELWNEMNAMKGPEDNIFFQWNEKYFAGG